MKLRNKRVCLNLSIDAAKKVREKSRKDDGWSPRMPTHTEYRQFGGLGQGVTVPDKGFTKQLHCLDEELEVAWDWGKQKWEIWRFPKDGSEAYHVLTVQTKDKNYRELGADILLKLQAERPERFSAGQLSKYFDEMDKQLRRRREKEFRNLVGDIARESFINLHCKLIQVPQTYKIANCVSMTGGV